MLFFFLFLQVGIKINVFVGKLIPELGFPDGSAVKNLSADAGDIGSIPGLGRSPGEGNGNLLQYSCLENLMERGARWATVHGVTESDTTEHAHVQHQRA